MGFDRTVVAAHVSAAFIADDQKAWGLEFARVNVDHDCPPQARRTCVKTYKSCDAALVDAATAAVGTRKATMQMT